jgi:aspartate/methionine/tyrosine aminotransferase
MPGVIRLKVIELLSQHQADGYTPSAGLLELRQAVAQYLSATRGLNYSPDDIVVSAGAKPFIYYTLACVTTPGGGHEVIYPAPGFPIYESMAKYLGAVPRPIPLRKSNKYHMDLDELERMFSSRTRLLILNSPHNPTGSMLTDDELRRIADILSRWPKVWILSDEVYSQLTFTRLHLSIASYPGMQARTVIVDGASKTYAMTGWRIGYAANATLANLFAKLNTNIISCPCHLSQRAVAYALTQDLPEVWRMKESYRINCWETVKGLEPVPNIECLLPDGAFYVYVDVGDICAQTNIPSGGEFADRLLRGARVAVTADSHFGTPPVDEPPHIRISAASSLGNITEGIRRMKDWFETLQ